MKAWDRRFWWKKLDKKRHLQDIHYMEDNTKMDRMEIRREGVDGIYLTQIRSGSGPL